MYQIIAYESPTDVTGHVVYDPRISKQLSDGKLDLKEAEIDSLELTVNQENWLFGHVKPLQTHVEVYQDETLLFRGRAFDISRQMKDDGQFIQAFNFESIQNYLQDTSQRWEKVQNTTPKQFFQRLIDTHNSQAPAYKKFQVRNVTVTNSTDNVYRYIEDGATTWDTIKDKLISRLGGYIVVEYKDGVNYIDYLQNVGVDHLQDTPIQLAKNLQSASVDIDPTEVITQLVPLGATIQDNNVNANPDTAVSQPRVDIKSVNSGKDYIDIPALQAEFGVIRKSVQWEDVHEPAILLSKAKQWIVNQSSAKESWSVSAIELPQFSSFKVSDRYVFIADQVATHQLLRVTAKTIDFANWQKSSLTIADKQLPLSQYQLENRKAAQLITKLSSRIVGYDTQIFNLNKQQEELNDTISNQQTLIDDIQKDVVNADLQGINSKLEGLSESVDDLGTQISNLDFVTPEEFVTYQNSQATINQDFEKRIYKLENKETGTNNG
ncbi:MAG: phage tail protein [Leuconostoc sp.]|nr:phage tail protein [Leuconostoc sp.]